MTAEPSRSDEGMRAAYARAAEFLEPRMDDVVADLGDLLRDELPAYTGAALETARDNVRVILDIALVGLRQGQGPGEMHTEALTTLAAKWAEEGQPLDPRTFQLGARRVMAVIAEHAQELKLDDHSLFVVQEELWDWANRCSSVLADARREHEVAMARRDAARRADFLRDLATGRMTAERLAGEGPTFSLDLDQRYCAVCADCDGEQLATALEAHVRRSGATSTHRTLQMVVAGRLLALTPQAPSAFDEMTIAVGSPQLLADAYASFSEAFDALVTARAFEIIGVVDLGSLGPLPLVREGDALAKRLSVRHLRELDALGEAGRELEETVRTLLELDRNIDATAAQLHLHRNTVRYRVTRFRDLTGLDPRRTDDLVTVWWLLNRRRAAQADERLSASGDPT